MHQSTVVPTRLSTNCDDELEDFHSGDIRNKPDDDVEEPEVRRGPRPGFANFLVDGEYYSYAAESIFGLKEDSQFRQWCVHIKCNYYVRSLFFYAVLLNSLVLALADFRDVDSSGNLQAHSVRNQIVDQSDIYFVVLFVFEALLKIFAMGLYSSKGGAYLNNVWNIPDFAISMLGIVTLSMGPGPGTSSVRALRSLRPIKALKKVPGINLMIRAVYESANELGNVLIVIGLVCFVFSVGGVVLFSGPYLHTRCRLTPFPVNADWVPGAASEAFRCIPEANVDIPSTSWSKDSSPWVHTRNCSWPVDDSDGRVCALTR